MGDYEIPSLRRFEVSTSCHSDFSLAASFLSRAGSVLTHLTLGIFNPSPETFVAVLAAVHYPGDRVPNFQPLRPSPAPAISTPTYYWPADLLPDTVESHDIFRPAGLVQTSPVRAQSSYLTQHNARNGITSSRRPQTQPSSTDVVRVSYILLYWGMTKQ
ncbi:hypothetical protein DFH09DRAFT_1067763 [Mycena vulgaris]|nr:hypothetical protein DFH09DRAFT_1067763 [Mycena vulgaris]